MVGWLRNEIGVELALMLENDADDCFDAGMAVLAALRGLNREWTLDLHDLPDADQSGRIRFCGRKHYWWPQITVDR